MNQNQVDTLVKDGKIHIGLVLAGAVTAGAYTAGVLDYLFNTLRIWEERYNEDENSYPKPNVVIDVIASASAGSMAGAIGFIAAASGKYHPIKLDDYPTEIDVKSTKSANLLYDMWVNYGLEKNENITDKIFSIADIDKNAKIRSLLNSEFIDDMIKKLKKNITSDMKIPTFLNPNIELLMTLSNLQGVQVDINMATKQNSNKKEKKHSMRYHKAYAHFEYWDEVRNIDPKKIKLSFKGNKNTDLFLKSARASGAFPLGLRSVTFEDVEREFIEANMKDLFGKNIEVSFPNNNQSTDSFMAVDGGMTNNEPMAEALKILWEKNSNKNANNSTENSIDGTNLRILMVDPFPSTSYDNNSVFRRNKNSIFDLIPMMYQALRNQSLFKEKDLSALFDPNSNKNMIWPSRSKRGNNGEKRVDNPLACSALGGFAGFFHKDFRHHDYMLGQKNCQNFLRHHFNVAFDEIQKTRWPEINLLNKFQKLYGVGPEQIQIIPDFRYDEDNHLFPDLEAHDKFPKYPNLDANKVITEELVKKIKIRATALTKGFEKFLKNDTDLPIILTNVVIPAVSRLFLRRKIKKKILNHLEDGLRKSSLIK